MYIQIKRIITQCCSEVFKNQYFHNLSCSSISKSYMFEQKMDDSTFSIALRRGKIHQYVSKYHDIYNNFAQNFKAIFLSKFDIYKKMKFYFVLQKKNLQYLLKMSNLVSWKIAENEVLRDAKNSQTSMRIKRSRFHRMTTKYF